MKGGAFLVDAGFRVARSARSGACARARLVSRSISISTVTSGRSPWQAMRSSSSTTSTFESAPAALIDQRRIGEAVAEHGLARFKGRADDLFDVLRAAGKVQQKFGAGRMAELAGSSRMRRISRPISVPPGSTVSTTSRPCSRSHCGEQAKLRGLATAVHAFECDEPAWMRSVMHGTWIFSDGNVPS